MSDCKVIVDGNETLVRRKVSPRVVGKVRICSKEEFAEKENHLAYNSDYALIPAINAVIEAVDSTDIIVSKLKPENRYKYLKEMAAWYFEKEVLATKESRRKFFKRWPYGIQYHRTTKLIMRILLILIGLIAVSMIILAIIEPLDGFITTAFVVFLLLIGLRL